MDKNQTKILSVTEYDALKAKADNFDKIVSSLSTKNANIKTEDITAETIVSALNTEKETENNSEELQTQLDAANQRAQTAEKRVTELEAEVEELSKVPTGGASTVKRDADTSEESNIVQFAEKHKGNTAAIMEELRKEGYK